MWHQGFNCNCTKLRNNFLCWKKIKTMTLFNNLSPPTIFESITCVNNGVLCQLCHAVTFFYVVYALIWEKTTCPCGAADTEQHVLFKLHLHLSDAFIQSDLHSGYTFSQYVCFLGIEATTFCTANAMLYHWATVSTTFSGYSPKWCQADVEEMNCWIKVVVVFLPKN